MNKDESAMIRSIVGLLATFGATALTAVVGSAASISATEFYARLAKPAWAPPAGVFGPVWTLLYVMMATAGWLIYRSGAPNTKALLGLFLTQLSLNALWSWTFFKWESGLGSIATIVVLWVSILATVVGFWRANSASGALMLPYLAWVSFAAALNWAIWKLNSGAL